MNTTADRYYNLSTESLILLLLVISSIAGATALDDFVAQPDPGYSYSKVTSAYDLSTFTRGFTLRLTSGSWRDSSQVSPAIWQHWVTIIVPEMDSILGATRNTALILIDGGNHNDPAPAIDANYRLLAAGTRSVLVILTAVPNQPLLFSDEIASRSEDEIIAYSWDKFLKTGDNYWPVQLPMVKSVVQCMNTVQDFLADEYHGEKSISSFILTGGSKRGWTTWLTAAVDNRVTAIIPIVSDLLNMERSFIHHWACHGFWAEALYAYEDLDIFYKLSTDPRAQELLEIVDPYQYRYRLDIPKLIINASGDNFFVSDSVRFYLDNLIGETYLRHVPNADHYLTDVFNDVLYSAAPWYDSILNQRTRPEFTWTIDQNGQITVVTVDSPSSVSLWQANNPNTRDFRLPVTGKIWTSTPLTDLGNGIYSTPAPQPESGWTAYFIELTFPASLFGLDDFEYKFTTAMNVWPPTLPYETDFNQDRLTDLADFAIFTSSWLSDTPFADIVPRYGGDNTVDLNDLTLFPTHWLAQPTQ